ncbi:hypothetical protein Tco_1280715 [Tanacetum coccineum]
MKDLLILWQSLKERFDHQKQVIFPKARYDWMHLRLQDFKSQQYRERGFKKYHKLISVFLVAEQNNELLMKSHQARPTGSTTLPEVNATSNIRGRGRKHDDKGKNMYNQASKNSGNACHRCGMKTHWAKQCRASRHFVDLYQASLEKKGKDIKTNFIDNDELILNVRLDSSDFFNDVEDVIQVKSTKFKDIRRNGYHLETTTQNKIEYFQITSIENGKKSIMERMKGLSSGLYFTYINQTEINMVSTLKGVDPKIFTLWHDRLGHPVIL